MWTFRRSGATFGVFALVGCASSHVRVPGLSILNTSYLDARSASVSRVTITPGGRIGVLRIGASTRNQVLAARGTPEAEETGQSREDLSPYDALGFGCIPTTPQDHVFITHVGNKACRTVFYINADTTKLEAFETKSSSYSTPAKIRVGISTRTLTQRAHRIATAGCLQAMYIFSKHSLLVAAIDNGGRPVKRRGPHGTTQFAVVHGHVGTIYMTTTTSAHLGLFDCIDA